MDSCEGGCSPAGLRCSWCGAAADGPDAVTLRFARFPEQETGCTNAHAKLLVQSRSDAPVLDEVIV
jgi:hypothetical protein